MKAIKNLSKEEMVFIFKMMQKYGGLTISDDLENNTTPKNNKNRHNNRRPPKKEPKNHDNCPTATPCLYDLGCTAWESCEDDNFLQYRLIIKKCE